MRGRPEEYICALHGAYPSTINEGRQSQYTCPACEIFERQIRASHDNAWFRRRAWEASGIPARYRDRTLASWQPQRTQHRVAKSMVEKFVEEFVITDSCGMVLLGPPGTGKTHLGCAVIVRTIELHGYSARYEVLPDLLAELKASFSRKGETEDIRSRLSNAALLVLDEIGVQAGSSWELGLLTEIIDERYRECRPLVLVSNARPDELPRWIGERATDRLREFATTIYLTGESFRGKPELRQSPGGTEPIPIPPERVEYETCDTGVMGKRDYESRYASGRRDLL